MVLDSSCRCETELESLGPQGCPGKVGSNKRIEWSSARAVKCDAKSMAARRKRSEIRRLRLMAAAHEDDNEPFQKRLKSSPSKKGSCETESNEAHGVPTVTVDTCMFEPRHIMQAFTGATNSSSGGSFFLASHTGSRQEIRSVNEGDGGGSTVESRLSISGSSVACPSHCVVSICGRSREMEDAAIAVPSFISMPSSVAGRRDPDTFHFYGVYDGHGGPQAAEFCKERMHGVLADEMSAAGEGLSRQWEACLQKCFGKLDAELCGLCPHGSECPCTSSANTSSSCQEPLVPGSVGTTAVVAVVGAEHIIVGNCGDSRAVLSRGGQVVPLSFDHKANRPDEVTRIEAAGGHVFSWLGHRVCGVLAMSRALGDSFLKPFVSGQPEVTVTARSDDDECLILASDGLWDVLSNEFVCGVARKALANWRRQHADFELHDVTKQRSRIVDTDEDSPAQVVAALLTKLALAKQSKDNISVVIVDLKRL